MKEAESRRNKTQPLRATPDEELAEAGKFGAIVDRTHRELTDDNIARISRTYHAWHGSRLTSSPSTGEDRDGGEYRDIPGFCKSATLREQQAEATKLDAATCLRRVFGRQVAANLKELGYGG
jgi:type I restriction-modification system DNA methylase subunit